LKRRNIYLAQAVYYFITGLWPVIDISSFMSVTGPKTDIWLVKMVGLLTVAISITLFTANNQGASIKVLALSAALAYMSIDLYYYFNGTLRIVYVGDAILEFIIILLVVVAKK
jgi:hypothetical protein